MDTDRAARSPAQASVTELMIAGFLHTDDVRHDGTVDDQVRAHAQNQFSQSMPTLVPDITEPSHLATPRLALRRHARPLSASPAQSSRRHHLPKRPATSGERRSVSVQTHADAHGSDDDALTCCICKTTEREFALLPCFHFCVCGGCLVRIDACPLCRTEIMDSCKIWI